MPDPATRPRSDFRSTAAPRHACTSTSGSGTSCASARRAPRAYNRMIERKVAELGGIKSLYSDRTTRRTNSGDLRRRRVSRAQGPLRSRGALPDLYAKCVRGGARRGTERRGHGAELEGGQDARRRLGDSVECWLASEPCFERGTMTRTTTTPPSLAPRGSDRRYRDRIYDDPRHDPYQAKGKYHGTRRVRRLRRGVPPRPLDVGRGARGRSDNGMPGVSQDARPAACRLHHAYGHSHDRGTRGAHAPRAQHGKAQRKPSTRCTGSLRSSTTPTKCG